MLIEILITLLIIIILLLFLLFFKTWYLHVRFKNNGYDHCFNINIKFLIFLFTIIRENSINTLHVQIQIFSKIIKLFEKDLSDKEEEPDESDNPEDESDDHEYESDVPENESDNQEDETKLYTKIIRIYPLLIESKEDLFQIIKLFIKTTKFHESYTIVNLGLKDNNLTIKFCTLLWTLTAPLYPLNFRLYLTPEINNLILKTDMNLKLKIKLTNILKIIFLVLKRKNLQQIIKQLLED